MSFLRGMLKPKKNESVALIDVSADSAGGAYVRITDGVPEIIYTARVPIEQGSAQPHEQAMARALQELGARLVHHGAPLLRRAAGSGSADRILVSLASPWQQTSIRTEHLQKDRDFTFTRQLIDQLTASGTAPAGHILADDAVIGTFINGYETNDPYGKQARRASVVVLTSTVAETAARAAADALRNLFHTKDIFLTGAPALRYQAMRSAFPHEPDCLIFDAHAPEISMAVVRRGAIADVVDFGKTEEEGWFARLKGTLGRLAGVSPLPRVVFVIARSDQASDLRAALHSPELGKLWFHDTPPGVVAVAPGHLSGAVKHSAEAVPDLPLMLMALYARQTGGE